MATLPPSWNGLVEMPPTLASSAAPAPEFLAEVDAWNRRIAAESIEKEAAKTELLTLSRAVELHARQIGAALSAAENAPAAGVGSACDHILRNIANFCDDMQDQLRHIPEDLQGEQAQRLESDTRSYDMLRQSLMSTQKRCAMLNEEMMRVADQNEELLSTMQSVKVTNRRLIDQIQGQSEEIARLTQFRLDDERRCEDLVHAQQSDLQERRLKLDEQIIAQQLEANTNFNSKQRQLFSKICMLREHVRSIGAEVKLLRNAHAGALTEAKGKLVEWRVATLDRFGRQLVDGIMKQRRHDDDLITQIEDAAHALKTKLDVEREAKERETTAWKLRDKELVDGNKDLAAKSSAKIAQIQTEIESTEATREVEARSSQQEKEHRSEALRDLVVQTASLGAMLQTSKTAFAALDGQQHRSELGQHELNEDLALANNKLRDSDEADEALDRGIANNERLRHQMEKQCLEAQDKYEKTLQDSANQFDEEIGQLTSCQQQEAGALARNIDALEHSLATQVAAVAEKRLMIEQHHVERASLQREIALWKAQEEVASRLRFEVERELSDVKPEYLRQLEALRECQDSLTAKQMSMEEELNNSRNGFSEFKRNAEFRAQQAFANARALDAKVQELEDELNATKHHLQNKMGTLANVRADLNVKRARSLEKQSEVEKELHRLRQESAEQREQLIGEAAMERQRARTAQLECDQLRLTVDTVLLELQGEPTAQISALEKSIKDLQESHRLDAYHGALKVDSNQKHVEQLAMELQRVQELLNDTETKLQAEVTFARTSRAEGDERVSNLHAEKIAAKESLTQSREEERNLASQLQGLEHASFAEQGRLAREITELTRLLEHHVRDSEIRIETLLKRQANEISTLENRLHAEAERDNNILEVVEAENAKLRQSIGESSVASSAGIVGTATASANDSLGRTQWRTQQLHKNANRFQRSV